MSDNIPSTRLIKVTIITLLERFAEVSLQQAIDYIAKVYELTDEEKARRQGCGKETVLQNRIRWARWQLTREGITETASRGYFRLKLKMGSDEPIPF